MIQTNYSTVFTNISDHHLILYRRTVAIKRTLLSQNQSRHIGATVRMDTATQTLSKVRTG